MTEERLMRYARAIARSDINRWIGPESELPSEEEEHEFWQAWKATAAVAIKVADEEHRACRTAPLPGSRREQLPAHILALLPPRDYLSSACETAQDLNGVIAKHPDMIEELLGWQIYLHAYCRLNHKFRGTGCICRCHEDKETI